MAAGSVWVMLKIMKKAKNRSLWVIYLLLLCSIQCWAFFLGKWCGDLEIDTKYDYVLGPKKKGQSKNTEDFIFLFFLF